MANPHDRGGLPKFPHSYEAKTTIATVCVLGTYRDPKPITGQRVSLLEALLSGLPRGGAWAALDAILLPAGYFRFAHPVGHLASADRMSALRGLGFAKACDRISQALHTQWPELTLVVGADSNALDRDYAGDQLVLAWRNGAIVGLARKAFPVWNETCDYEANVWVHPDDADDPHRFITLRNGARAVLCVCYDAFALRAVKGEAYADLAAIHYALQPYGEIGEFPWVERWRHLTRWVQNIQLNAPELALVPIHYFWQPGRDGYWQRHGIAGASAALDGAPVLGAAHFQRKLPRQEISTLAARGVEQLHLTLGGKRLAQRLFPQHGFYLHGSDGEAIALVRLFQLDRRIGVFP